MRPAQQELVSLGFRLGFIYPALTFLISYIKNWGVEFEFSLILFSVHFGISLPPLLMQSDRQVSWYGTALFVPWSCVWGANLGAALLGGGLALVGWATWLVVPAAPLVWLVGALWIRWDDRRNRRLLAR